MREHRVVSGEVELAVRERGEAGRPTVLLLHGFPDTAVVWDEVAGRLAERFHVVTYDVRGAGASSAPESVEDYRMPLLLEDLRAVIDATSPDAPVHLVGHDWGAIQGWSAVASPRLAGRIASFTSAGGADLDHVTALLRRIARTNPAAAVRQLAMSSYIGMMQVPGLPELTVRRALAPMFPTMLGDQGVAVRAGHPAETLERDMLNGLNLYRANARTSGPAEAAPVQVPVQLVVCTRDQYLSVELAGAHASLADRVWVRRVATGHWIQRTRPGLFSTWITEFADAVERGGIEFRRFGAFEGQLVVVTGAGSGIGRATAYGFAANGARVVAADIDEVAAKRTADGIAGLSGPGRGTAYAHQVDVADAEAMRRFAAEVRDAYGVPDVVVNNAGIGVAGSLLDTSEEDWDRITSVNLDGVYRGCRLFGRQMSERGEGGHLVNIASMAAFSPTGSLGAYSATKAAVLQLSECLRIELASTGIGVSAICPGIVNTPITRNSRYVGVSPDEAGELRDFVSRAFERRNFPPEKVALAIMRAVLHDRPVVPVAPEAHVGRALSRFAPAAGRALGRLGEHINARRLRRP